MLEEGAESECGSKESGLGGFPVTPGEALERIGHSHMTRLDVTRRVRDCGTVAPRAL